MYRQGPRTHERPAFSLYLLQALFKGGALGSVDLKFIDPTHLVEVRADRAHCLLQCMSPRLNFWACTRALSVRA